MTKAVSWLDRNFAYVCENLASEFTTTTSEQIRFWLKSKRLRAAPVPQYYGILIKKAVDSGLLLPTNKVVKKTGPNARGKTNIVYKVSKKKIAA